jgi:hypothetical protein
VTSISLGSMIIHTWVVKYILAIPSSPCNKQLSGNHVYGLMSEHSHAPFWSERRVAQLLKLQPTADISLLAAAYEPTMDGTQHNTLGIVPAYQTWPQLLYPPLSVNLLPFRDRVPCLYSLDAVIVDRSKQI